MPEFAEAIGRRNWEKHGERPSALDFIPSALHAAIWNETGTSDLSPYLQKMVDSIPNGARATFRIPKGKYKLSSTVNLGTRRITFKMDGSEIECSASIFSVTGSSAHDAEDGGAYTIIGSDHRSCILTYTGSGVFVDFNRVVKGGLQNLTIKGVGTGIGVRLYSADKIILKDVHVEAFDVNVQLTGPGKAGGAAYTRTNTIQLTNLVLRAYTTCGMDFAYCEEVFLTNVQSYVSNPGHEGKWGWKIGTSSFAVYGQTVSLMGGGLLISWVPDADPQELPPNWLFFDNLLCDWPWETSALYIDDSLMTMWGGNLPGRGYRFTNCWFAAADYGRPTETSECDDPHPNVYIGGGHDIEFVNCKIRASRSHGIQLHNALGDVKLLNCTCYANWFNNSGVAIANNGAGLYIDSTIGQINVQVIGGQYTSEGSDVGGHQQYGVYNASSSVYLQLIGVDLQGNEIAPTNSIFGDRACVLGNFYGFPPWQLETAVAVTGATNASPVAITTATAHGYSNGQGVRVAGVRGNFGANGWFKIIVTGANTFTLTGSHGTGTYTSGGVVSRHGYVITGASNATPIEITCTGHPFATSDRVRVAEVAGNAAANGDWWITKTGANTFTLDDSVGDGTYTTGGQCGKAAAVTSYNRVFGDRVRWEIGDSNFYLDKGILGNNPIINFDEDDYVYYDRVANSLSVRINGVETALFTETYTRFLSNLQSYSSDSGLGSWIVSKCANAAGGYKVGLGNNAWFDGTNWKTKGDSASNGAALILTEYGSGNLKFYVIPTTGGGDQTISNTDLEDYLVATMTSAGMDLPGIQSGTGSPEGVISGGTGTLYRQTNGNDAISALWVKEVANVGGNATLGWRSRGNYGGPVTITPASSTATTVLDDKRVGTTSADDFNIVVGGSPQIKLAAAGTIGLGGDAPAAADATVKVYGAMRVEDAIRCTFATPDTRAGFDADGNLVTDAAKVDLGDAADVEGTGLANGQGHPLYWDSTAGAVKSADYSGYPGKVIGVGGSGQMYATGLDVAKVPQMGTGLPHTVPLAKITSGGADGSITFNADGSVTCVDPT